MCRIDGVSFDCWWWEEEEGEREEKASSFIAEGAACRLVLGLLGYLGRYRRGVNGAEIAKALFTAI